jgi:transcriptional regulator with XRE-family HTH domain
MKKRAEKAFDRSGSSFDSFLEEEGIREEVEAVAVKRVLAWELSQEMKRQRKTKQEMALELRTSRSQLDRLLDPRNVSVSLETMTRAAGALGKSLVFRIADRKGRRSKRAAARPAKKQPVRSTFGHAREKARRQNMGDSRT